MNEASKNEYPPPYRMLSPIALLAPVVSSLQRRLPPCLACRCPSLAFHVASGEALAPDTVPDPSLTSRVAPWKAFSPYRGVVFYYRTVSQKVLPPPPAALVQSPFFRVSCCLSEGSCPPCLVLPLPFSCVSRRLL